MENTFPRGPSSENWYIDIILSLAWQNQDVTLVKAGNNWKMYKSSSSNEKQ